MTQLVTLVRFPYNRKYRERGEVFYAPQKHVKILQMTGKARLATAEDLLPKDEPVKTPVANDRSMVPNTQDAPRDQHGNSGPRGRRGRGGNRGYARSDVRTTDAPRPTEKMDNE